MIGLDRLIDIGQRLRLDALAGIDHQKRSLTGRQRARHLIAEIDMARRVHQVQDVILAVIGGVVQPHRLCLDGDPALALDIHIVEDLLGHLALGQPSAHLNQAVGDGRLAMVDMRDNREIADVVCRGHRGPERLFGRALAAVCVIARRGPRHEAVFCRPFVASARIFALAAATQACEILLK